MEQRSLVIDIRSLLDSLGETIQFDTSVALPVLSVGSEEFVPLDTAHVTGVLTNTGAGVVLAGAVDVLLEAVCCRCLKDFTLPVSVEIEGFYVVPGAECDLPEEQEVAFIEEGSVDIMEAVLSALTLELPFAPLHDEGCLGICPICGADRNETPCSCVPETLDSPFAALKDLFPSDERVD